MNYLTDNNTFRKFGLAVLAAALFSVHGAQAQVPINPALATAVGPAPLAVAPTPVVWRIPAWRIPAVARARLARRSGIGLILGVGY
jgi:hypothetical protein